MRRSVARVALVGLVATAVAGCGIDPDAGPRVVPADQRGQLDPGEQEAGPSAGASRIFLLVDDENGRVLRSVLRDVPDEPAEVLQALVDGPNDSEIADGLQSALPVDVEVISAREVAGTVNVDLSPQIQDLQSNALRLAVAQIVFTVGEVEGVKAVRLRVDGENKAWPDGRGDLQNDPLTVYDFPGYAESAQPAYPPVPSDTVP